MSHASYGGVEIRSFRVCFRLERRIHKIDRWRIPLPYGMPVRGIVYALIVEVAVLVAMQLPILSALLGLLHPILRYAALPIGVGYLLTELVLDGRSGPAVVRSCIRVAVEPRRLVAFRRAPATGRVLFAPLTMGPDEHGPRLRRAVIEGNGRVIVRQPAELEPHGRTLRVLPREGEPMVRGRQVGLRPGQRMVIA